jgi:hypothetical protein
MPAAPSPSQQRLRNRSDRSPSSSMTARAHSGVVRAVPRSRLGLRTLRHELELFTRSVGRLPVIPSQLSRRATSTPPDAFRSKRLFGITRTQQLLAMTQQHVDSRLDTVHSSLERGSRIELPPNADARKCKKIWFAIGYLPMPRCYCGRKAYFLSEMLFPRTTCSGVAVRISDVPNGTLK